MANLGKRTRNSWENVRWKRHFSRRGREQGDLEAINLIINHPPALTIGPRKQPKKKSNEMDDWSQQQEAPESWQAVSSIAERGGLIRVARE